MLSRQHLTETPSTVNGLNSLGCNSLEAKLAEVPSERGCNHDISALAVDVQQGETTAQGVGLFCRQGVEEVDNGVIALLECPWKVTAVASVDRGLISRR
jgi:hypothetical protein